MHTRVSYFLLCCVIVQVICKPLQIEENDSNESDDTEYEVLNDSPVSNVPDRDDNDIAVGDRDASADQGSAVRNQGNSAENEYQTDTEQRRLEENAETFPDKRSSENLQVSRYQSKKHCNNDLRDDIQYANNRDANNYEVNSPQYPIRNEEPKKRTIQLPTRTDDDSMLFNRDEVSKIDNKYNNNEGLDTSEQAHFFKQYHNTMQTDNKRGIYDQTYENELFGRTRERREARQSLNLPNIPNKRPDDTDTLDEEMAIRKHIKKLSDTELKELLNSLTDEKRQLLKKIIDDTHVNFDTYENINKREITKKAGALEENNLVENVQSELSKIQPSSSSADENTESPESTNADRTTLNKQTENPDAVNTNSDNKIEVSSTSELNQVKSDKLNALTSGTDTKTQHSDVQESPKCENKRETNYNDFLTNDISLDDTRLSDNELDSDNSPDSTFDQEYVCSQEDDMSQLIDDRIEKQKEDYKREAYSVTLDDLPDSLKSLEESFPNSNAYSNSASYSGPLVRVKRKDLNHNMKKRSAGVLPHAKTGYFQYRAESDEVDNDEGNEFDDDGFYDVTSNLAKNKAADDAACDNSASQQSATDSGNALSSDSPVLSSNNNVPKDTVNLGTDTDSVISGVEGVDDNLMYNSNSRNRRNDDKIPNNEKICASHSTHLAENGIKTELYMNAPNYQENDSFGPLPQNSEGDLGRYKRIRRLKPLHDTEEASSHGA